MEEVAGDASVLVVPGDVRGLADALDARLSRAPEANGSEEDRRRRGFDIVSGHTWAASAERHLGAYRSAAGRSGDSRG